MASQFESLIQPLIIICTIPLALVGVVTVFWFMGGTGDDGLLTAEASPSPIVAAKPGPTEAQPEPTMAIA